MTHREHPLQEPVVDGFGGADGSVGEEEGSEGGEDGVGHGDAAVDRQVKPDVGARAVGRRRLDRRGRRRPGWTDGRMGRFDEQIRCLFRFDGAKNLHEASW